MATITEPKKFLVDFSPDFRLPLYWKNLFNYKEGWDWFCPEDTIFQRLTPKQLGEWSKSISDTYQDQKWQKYRDYWETFHSGTPAVAGVAHFYSCYWKEIPKLGANVLLFPGSIFLNKGTFMAMSATPSDDGWIMGFEEVERIASYYKKVYGVFSSSDSTTSQ